MEMPTAVAVGTAGAAAGATPRPPHPAATAAAPAWAIAGARLARSCALDGLVAHSACLVPRPRQPRSYINRGPAAARYGLFHWKTSQCSAEVEALALRQSAAAGRPADAHRPGRSPEVAAAVRLAAGLVPAQGQGSLQLRWRQRCAVPPLHIAQAAQQWRQRCAWHRRCCQAKAQGLLQVQRKQSCAAQCCASPRRPLVRSSCPCSSPSPACGIGQRSCIAGGKLLACTVSLLAALKSWSAGAAAHCRVIVPPARAAPGEQELPVSLAVHARC